MEDNEETKSPASPRSDGRVALTVAVSAPPQSAKCLAVALPLQQQGKSGSGGREDCWSEGSTAVLIDAWGERYLELCRGNLKQKHWKEVAEIVNSKEGSTKSDVQCKNRIDTVKKKYKLEKAKMGAGHGQSMWAFFEKLDRLISPAARISGGGFAGSPPNTGNQKVPVGFRSARHLRRHQPSPPPQLHQKHKQAFPKKPLMVELSQAILKLGEAYERSEKANVQQMVELEKQRMKFAKEIELQRIQFFMQTQMDLSQLHNRGDTKPSVT